MVFSLETHHDLMACIWEKAIQILAGTLNSGRSYLITAALTGWFRRKTLYPFFWCRFPLVAYILVFWWKNASCSQNVGEWMIVKCHFAFQTQIFASSYYIYCCTVAWYKKWLSWLSISSLKKNTQDSDFLFVFGEDWKHHKLLSRFPCLICTAD